MKKSFVAVLLSLFSLLTVAQDLSRWSDVDVDARIQCGEQEAQFRAHMYVLNGLLDEFRLKPEDALEAYRIALSLDPDNKEALSRKRQLEKKLQESKY